MPTALPEVSELDGHQQHSSHQTAAGQNWQTGRLLDISASRNFPNWLAEKETSLAFTTYQAGKLFFLGLKPDGALSVFERTFERCLGLCGDGQTLWMSSQYQIWRFENMLPPDSLSGGYDRLYVPQVGYTTGDLDAHDISVNSNGRPVFVNTLFGCLATVSDRYSFEPLWKPPFISKLAAEDRCHLNGLAMEDGQPAYVTAVSQSDVADGWRDHRRDGGCVIHVPTNEIVATGLSMPHSPRLYRDKLWLLNSGTGSFGFIDRQTGTFEEVAFCPGYARGLTFVDNYAVIGLSRPREATFRGLALDDKLAERNADSRCGLIVVDLDSGDIVHWVRIEGIVSELYDVVSLPIVQRPKALGFRTNEIRHSIWFEDGGALSNWHAEDR
ncbi:MAG: TIGR03032 family protein [Planctomycetaceae bacterium]|nr:TIGR03032 family protein [Planctomycetaceae bacterium]